MAKQPINPKKTTMDTYEEGGPAKATVEIEPDKINPGHYKDMGVYEPVKIIEAFFPEDGHLSHAAKYLLRAGRKDGSPAHEDLKKARWWITRWLQYHGFEGKE